MQVKVCLGHCRTAESAVSHLVPTPLLGLVHPPPIQHHSLQGRCYHYPHFTDDATKTQRGQASCPKSHSQQTAKPGFKCEFIWFQTPDHWDLTSPMGHPKEKKWGQLPHLAIHHLGLLGPVPHGKHVIVGFVYCTEQVAPVLGGGERRGRGARWVRIHLPQHFNRWGICHSDLF